MLSIDNNGNLKEQTSAFYTSEVMNYLLEIIHPHDLEKLITLLIAADMNTNSLTPLNEESPIEDWCRVFLVESTSDAQRLLNLALHFEIIRMFPEQDKYTYYPHTTDYVLNPYFLSWTKAILPNVSHLFDDTDIAIIAKSINDK